MAFQAESQLHRGTNLVMFVTLAQMVSNKYHNYLYQSLNIIFPYVMLCTIATRLTYQVLPFLDEEVVVKAFRGRSLH